LKLIVEKLFALEIGKKKYLKNTIQRKIKKQTKNKKSKTTKNQKTTI